MKRVILRTDGPDSSGRIYEPKSLNFAFENYTKHAKVMYGELGHPHGYSVSLSEISHFIDSLYYDLVEGAYCADIRVLDTPRGQILKNLIEQGIEFDFKIMVFML